jgi:hypothetical protein
MNAYSLDLRQRIVAAKERGISTAGVASISLMAENNSVSKSSEAHNQEKRPLNE